jgi:hypothetical protein
VRRWLLLTIALSAVLWTVDARTGSIPPGDILAMSSVDACALDRDSNDPGDSDRQWRARHDALAPVTESVWKSAQVHADIASTPSPLPFDTTRFVRSPGPPSPPAPHYLRHTPLLI